MTVLMPDLRTVLIHRITSNKIRTPVFSKHDRAARWVARIGYILTDVDSLLISETGRPLCYDTVSAKFRRLSRKIGLRGEPGQPGPRIHDLRHTFAVRSLERCPCNNEAVSRHILASSTYLGHVHVADTYWYLQATPGLMVQIADASETFGQGGQP
jgi:integrase